MRRALIALALVSAATLSASDNEVNLVVSKQITRDDAAHNLKTEQPVAKSIRYGADVLGLGPAQVQLQATYHGQSTADLSSSSTVTDFKNTGFSLGLQAQMRMGLTLGAGAEIRVERLKGTVSGSSTSTTQVRPWLTGRVGFSVPLPVVQPVFGLEVAVPVTNKSTDSGSISAEDQLKRLSPKFEVSAYGGIRF